MVGFSVGSKGHIVLVRGLPGSGKSTIAKKIVESNPEYCVHYEADMFFIDEAGTYSYSPSKIKEAHAWCQGKVKEAYDSGKTVVVSNTFVKMWEMRAYLDIDPNASILEAKGRFQNVHGVSQEVLDRMLANWESIGV